MLPLLADAPPVWKVVWGTEEFVIPVSGCIRRARASETHRGLELRLRDTVDKLSAYFAEAASLGHSHVRRAVSSASTGPGISRLRWSDVWDRWAKISNGEEPLMARIVEIALNHSQGIREVCERPRRLLVRRREQLRLGNVQELDASCLRDLIRRPGHSILEKAGARQEITAIVRRETVDTPENRVIRDLLDLCRRRARAYEREYFRAHHPRVRAVWGLRQTCERLAEGSAIAGAGKLVGTAHPNYVLQKDRRYHPLWVQYDRLRREDGAIDSVWPTVRFLWSDFVRAVVVSHLCRFSNSRDAKWSLGGELTAYLRSEHRDGLFIPPMSVSSRWSHISRRLRLFVVHPAHAHLCPGLERSLPRLGVDLALVVYGPADGPNDKPIGVLSLHTVMSLRSTAEERRAMEESLSRSLDRFSEETGGLKVSGLLLRADQELEDEVGEMLKIGRLSSWTAPAGGAWWFGDEGFTFWLELLLEELAT